MTAILDRADIVTTLEEYVERCREELDRAELALNVYRHGPGPEQQRLDEQPAKTKAAKKPAKAKASTKKPAPSNGGGV